MKSLVTTRYPRVRPLIHPGLSHSVRINTISAPFARHVRLKLMPGLTLHEALVRPLAAMGIENASTTILGGSFKTLQYCVAPPDPEKRAIIAYSKPIDAGACSFIFGNATLGKSATGDPLVHCHATIRTDDGAIKGGHIITEASIIADAPISVLVTSFDDFELRQVFDTETNIPLLQPYKDIAHA